MLLGAALRQIEREAKNAVDADPAHYRFLHHDLAFGARIHLAADGRIFAFRVFADNEKIDVARFASAQR